ncbi:MAG: histidine kinase, partial [Thermicanus sp.]|nr:histidine kinase [Thermicanus sp.]
MKRIQTRVMALFLILILLMNGISFILYHLSQQTIDQYDEMLKRFLLYNDISNRSSGLVDELQAYLTDKSLSFYESYLRQKRELAERRQALLTLMDRPAYPIEMKNYSSLIDSLIKESEEVILGFHQEDLYLTSSHYRETQQISGFIQETTLSMINLELSQYHLLYQRMIDRNDALQKMGWSLYGAIFLLGMLLAYAFSNTLTSPIRQLAMAAKRIEQGDLNGENLKVPGRDELSFLTESFNRMRSNLRHMVGEIIKKSELEQELKQQALKNSEMDRLLKEMTLRSLQNQINPHFLFNTLNTLAKSAYVEGAEKTSDLITSVANLLRYTLKEREQKTTVAEEIDHVREYVTIQQARFGTRRIRVSFHLDQELLTEPLPLLTLQPL